MRILFKRYIPSIIALFLAAGPYCASDQQAAQPESPFKECAHCHGTNLEGVRNIKLQCGGCHDLAPLAAGAIRSQSIKDTIFSEPHIHRAENMFSNTPSCFFCHRRSEF